MNSFSANHVLSSSIRRILGPAQVLPLRRGATGSTPPTPLIESRVDLVAAALIMIAALTRTREAAPIPASSDADRAARAAGRRCGCWPTSTFLFRGIVVGSFGGGRWRSGAPTRRSRRQHRRRSAGAGRAQRATGSSTTIANSAAPTVTRRYRTPLNEGILSCHLQ